MHGYELRKRLNLMLGWGRDAQASGPPPEAAGH